MKLPNFYPRPPRGGRPLISRAPMWLPPIFLSTPSARRATIWVLSRLVSREISIHALREEGDTAFVIFVITPFDFYPRPPRGGRRIRALPVSREIDFYPRPPRGGRQLIRDAIIKASRFLSTPSARRATNFKKLKEAIRHISIHALREEGDTSFCSGSTISSRFLSTPSARRATNPLSNERRTLLYFYPRPPRGGRRRKRWRKMAEEKFLSTPSARRATVGFEVCSQSLHISIHALREEGDFGVRLIKRLINIFLSTPSARRATRRRLH